jgi:hypothetical protein
VFRNILDLKHCSRNIPLMRGISSSQLWEDQAADNGEAEQEYLTDKAA